MTNYLGWTPPPGVAVVPPPVHPKTWVSVLYSDGQFSKTDYEADTFNWSSVGDGPRVVAYAVVSEYKPAPELREWWVVDNCEAWDDKQEALWNAGGKSVIHVREVLPEPPLDLTKITTPFGLLDEATQAALKAHGGPYEFCNGHKWRGVFEPGWFRDYAYRVAPSAAPAKPAPREVVAWAVVGRNGHATEICFDEGDAMECQRKYGGTVRPLGYLP